MTDDLIHDRFLSGQSMTEIAEQLGATITSVRAHLLRRYTAAQLRDLIMELRLTGLAKTRHNRISAEKLRTVVQRYTDGETLDRIGQSYGVGRERVRQWIKLAGKRTKDLRGLQPPTLVLDEPIGSCVVCLGDTYRRRGTRKRAKYPTCSKACHGDFWRVRRYLGEHARHEHRLAVCAYMVRSGKGSPRQIENAKRILAGGSVKPYRIQDKPRPGTKIREAWDRMMAKRAKNQGAQ